jgi:hypothetical protein
VALYHVRGTTDLNTRGIQVEEKATSLNSGDVFVLLNPSTEMIWYGKGASDTERATAKRIADKLVVNRNQVEMNEGEETDEFWETLGGQTPYATSKVMEAGAKPPRLFQCSNVTGDFVVEEIFNFNQDDMTMDDVFLLDTFDQVWLWVGADANRNEKQLAFQAAIDFVANAPDGRDRDTPILKIDPGREPPMFTSHFFGWDDNKFNSGGGDPYLEKLKALKGEAAVERISDALNLMGYLPTSTKFSYDDLKAKRVDKIDPTKRHEYLSDEDFHRVFGMDLATFDVQPAWKQKQLKQQKKLF